MSREDDTRLGTADIARAGEPQRLRDSERTREALDRSLHDATAMTQDRGMQAEPLAALFQGPMAEDFRRRWDTIQIGFVDDPRAAVRNADELVAEVLRSLAESFAEQRSGIEAGLGGQEQGNTENMRLALQRYRSFFQRLLSL